MIEESDDHDEASPAVELALVITTEIPGVISPDEGMSDLEVSSTAAT